MRQGVQGGENELKQLRSLEEGREVYFPTKQHHIIRREDYCLLTEGLLVGLSL